MSVINRMLTDLQARGAAAPQAGPAVAVGAGLVAAPQPGPAGRMQRLRLLALAGAGLAALMALADWPAWLHRADRAPQPALLGDAAPSAAAVQADAAMQPAEAAPRMQPVVAAATARTADRLTGLSYDLSLRPASRAPGRAAGPLDGPAARTPAPASVGTVLPRKRSAASAPAMLPPTPSPAPAGSAPAPARIDKQMLPASATQRAAQAYRQATELAATGLSTQAIEQAQEALRHDPGHDAARQLAAVLLFEKSRPDEARNLLADGLARPDPDPRLAYLMARLLVETGERDAALQVLARIAVPDSDAHGLRAGILARQGRYGEALPSYEAAVRLAPDHAPWWLGLGVALDALARPAEARQAFQHARALGSLQGDLLSYVEHKLAVTR